MNGDSEQKTSNAEVDGATPLTCPNARRSGPVGCLLQSTRSQTLIQRETAGRLSATNGHGCQ